MEITIGNARIEDFDAVTRIMNQVQQLHMRCTKSMGFK